MTCSTFPRPHSPIRPRQLLTLYTSTLNIDKNNFRSQARRRLANRQQDRSSRRLRNVYRKNLEQHLLCSARRERRLSSRRLADAIRPRPIAEACAPTFPNVFFTPPGPAPAAPFAGALTPTVGIPGGTLTPSQAAVHGMVPDFVNPTAHEAEVTIERQLPGRMSFSATYLMTRGLHLPASYDANVAPTTATRTYDVLAGSAVGLRPP